MPNPPEDTAHSFAVSDYIAWGKLVKSWATGKNYFDAAKPAPPLPRSIADLQQQCENLGFEITFAKWIQGLVVTQYSKDSLFLRLPPKDLIERGEGIVTGPGGYPLPDFYRTFFGANARPPDKAAQLDAHHARIGEYTINSCL